MESRAFIRSANTLIRNIKDINLVESVRDTSTGGPDPRHALQKEINQLFAALQNPTLPTAYKLRDAALENGFSVDHKVQHRLSQFENLV